MSQLSGISRFRCNLRPFRRRKITGVIDSIAVAVNKSEPCASMTTPQVLTTPSSADREDVGHKQGPGSLLRLSVKAGERLCRAVPVPSSSKVVIRSLEPAPVALCSRTTVPPDW